jgi:ectoine hydroxylase
MTADIYPTRKTNDPTFIPRRDPVAYGTPADGPLSASELAGFDLNGFHAIDQLVSPGEVAAYRAELRRLSENEELKADERTVVEPGSSEVRSIFEVHKISEVFASLRVLADKHGIEQFTGTRAPG